MPTPSDSTSREIPPVSGSERAPILEMEGVAVPALRDPEVVVLEGVNWRVAVGDFWVVGGLHASGKSDFMAVAAGIVAPSRGTFRAFGHELVPGFEQDQLAVRLRMGMVFDGGHLLHHLTIAENVSLPMRYHRNCPEESCASRVEALLDLTELSAWASRYPGQLSHNRRQRAGLARALALQPEVLLLDSPLTGLDPRDAAWWLDLLAQLSSGHAVVAGRPLTIIASADDLRVWKGRARQFAVLREKTFVNFNGPAEAAPAPEAWLASWFGPGAAPE